MKTIVAIIGRTNSGKSTLFNALIEQSGAAIVSPQKGTTTDPVRKAYELLGYGAITLVDTAGFDDCDTPLGQKRVQKTMQVAHSADMVVMMLAGDKIDSEEQKIMAELRSATVVVRRDYDAEKVRQDIRDTLLREVPPPPPFYGDKLHRGECVLLVCPIDSEAPEGRLILPQVQALRAALDINATAIVVQPPQLEGVLKQTAVQLIVTDSQAFDAVTPVAQRFEVPLTSFSILLAAQKADMDEYQRGLEALEGVTRDSKILLVEHCSHGVSCDDIARVKIPLLLRQYYGFEVVVDIVSGRESLPCELSRYALVVQCGGCMVGRGAVMSAIHRCRSAAVPVTNYGLLLRRLLVGARVESVTNKKDL